MALKNMLKHNLNINITQTQTREPGHQKCDKPVGTGGYVNVKFTQICVQAHYR